ncbi:MAG: menaquinone biosynthesis protein [Puia sp.]|nr:menaquinone biosynthesis protein [Puia sp.]
MDRKIRIGAVSYLNTKPLLYGIYRSPVITDIDLTIDYPSRIASMLVNDEIDMGLVPVAVIPFLKEYHLNTGFCIGSSGPVASVCIFSETPIGSVDKVLLDYQSRTSVQLAKVLLREYWRISPVLVDAPEDFRDHIKGRTAGVVIGDRALEQRKISPYVYDLGEAWMALTGLPFVFAAWISNKRLDPEFVARFDVANRQGLEHIPEVVKENPYTLFDLHEYFTDYLDYRLDGAKLAGLERFLRYLREPVPAEAG